MIWTHIYDLLLKLITMVLIILLFIFLAATNIPFFENKGIVIVIIGLLLYFVVYHLWIRTIATYLYCKFTLKMKINLSQAKQLNEAFSPANPINMKWLPMKELRNINDDNKFQLALSIYENWAEEKQQHRKQQLEDFKNAKQHTKLLTIIMYVLVVYFMLAGFMDLPPANYIKAAYCKLFNTEEYYPLLNGVILALPTVLFFRAFDKNIKW